MEKNARLFMIHMINSLKIKLFKCMCAVAKYLPAEFSHNVFIFICSHISFVVPKLSLKGDDVVFFGKKVKNMYGIAAGLDKDAKIVKSLFKMGFGFVEVGTVTLEPQSGNAKPRVFRINSKKSLLNSMGFPSNGSECVLERIKKCKRKDKQVLGVNIGRNKNGQDLDILILIDKFCLFCDYIAINISSPNTAGLRDLLADNNKLEDFLASINDFCIVRGIKTPIFLKISPDVENLQDIYTIACRNGISGFILTNTTTDYSILPEKFQKIGRGGISGDLLGDKSENLLKEFHKINIYNKFIFSVGGISSDDDAQKRIKYGADAVQIYTGLVFGSFFN